MKKLSFLRQPHPLELKYFLKQLAILFQIEMRRHYPEQPKISRK